MPSPHTGDRIVASKEWDWAGGAVAVGVEGQREREEQKVYRRAQAVSIAGFTMHSGHL